MYISPNQLKQLSTTDRKLLRQRMNELAERAASCFMGAVRPIYGATESGTPNHIGSSILINIQGIKFLLTAAHIIDLNEEMRTTLYIGGQEGQFVQINADFTITSKPDGERDNDQYDFAVARLSSEITATLGNGYLTEDDIGLSIEPGHLYTAVGFPNSKNRWFDRGTGRVVARGFHYSSTCRFNDQIADRLASEGRGAHHVFLGYTKHSRSTDGIKVSSTEPRGLSGGAIIDAGCPSDLRVFRAEILPIPRLVGMTIMRWKDHQVLIGTRMSVILPVIKALAQAPFGPSAAS